MASVRVSRVSFHEVRVVQTGPDGFLYLGVQRASDGTGGVIARIRPVVE